MEVEVKEVDSFEEVDISDSFEKLNDEQPIETPPVVPKKEETVVDSDEEEVEKDSDDADDDKDTDEQPDVKDVDSDVSEEDKPVKFTIGENEYTEEELQIALTDSKNKSEWQKSNTEKAQEIGDLRKTQELRKDIEPVVTLINKLREDTDLFLEIKEAMVEKFGDEIKPIFDAAFKFDVDKYPNPYKTELETEQQKTRELTSEIVLSKEKITLKELHKLKNSQVDEVYDFAVDKYNVTGTFLSLEDAYKLMDYDVQVKKAAETKVPAIPNVPSKKKGATNIKQTKKLPGSIDEVTFDEFEGKLFEEDK